MTQIALINFAESDGGKFFSLFSSATAAGGGKSNSENCVRKFPQVNVCRVRWKVGFILEEVSVSDLANFMLFNKVYYM